MNIFLINDKALSKGDKVQLGISYFLQATLIVAIFYFIYHQDWVNTFLTSGIFVLTSLPAIFRKSYKVRLPVELDFIVILFIYAALFLGEVHGYYTKFWWWDILLHASSGVLFGIAGFLLVYILNQEKKVMLHLKPFFIGKFGNFNLTAKALMKEGGIIQNTMNSSSAIRKSAVFTIFQLPSKKKCIHNLARMDISSFPQREKILEGLKLHLMLSAA